jgi:hypothetical protein
VGNIRGKSYKAVAFDVSEGYTSVNPLFLKPLDSETIKEFYIELLKTQGEVRNEHFKTGDLQAIRWRNMRLQRLHSATMIIKNYARERKIPLS